MDRSSFHQTIPQLTVHCHLALEALCQKHDSEEERGRFRVWAANLGAHQHAWYTTSLEYRLRDAPKMRTSVISGLERLQSVADRARKILNGEVPNRFDDTEPDATNELHQLILGLNASLNHLFALSMLIRRRRPNGRSPGLDSFIPLDSSPDISGVVDKYPKLKGTLWLAKRLGNAIAQRRHYIQYRQEHSRSLGKQRQDLNDWAIIADYESTVNAATTTTIATTYREDDGPQSGSPTAAQATDLLKNRFSTCTFATSFMSTNDERLGRRIPDLTDMVLDQNQLDYNKPFECPYCRTIQVATNRLEWKKHVFADLQPYSCTFKDCASPLQLFTNRHEWLQHETVFHRRHWICNQCRDSEPEFYKEDEAINHLKSAHSNTVTTTQLPFVLNACESTRGFFGKHSCLFCHDWSPGSDSQSREQEYYRHVARHQQLLALESLPLHIEGLEVNDPGDEVDSIGTHPPLDDESGDDTEETQEYNSEGNEYGTEETSGNLDVPARTSTEDTDKTQSYSPSEVGISSGPSKNTTRGNFNVLWLAASLFEFSGVSRYEAGYPYLGYQAGEIFDVIGETGELWLARNQDDPDNKLGWIWSKHFARLADD